MLSHKCKYAIKALEYIGRNKNRGSILIAEISEQNKIPKKFLESILLELKKDGILQSKMGKNGGYSLMKKPTEINIGHIIRLIDGPIALLPCVSYKYYKRCEDCEDEDTCSLHHMLAKLREANNKILNKVSLSEFLK